MAQDGIIDPEAGKIKKANKPANFVGKIAVLSALDRIGYKKGDLIDYVDADQDLGNLVWDDPRFLIVYINDADKAGLDFMKEDHLDGTGKKVEGQRRKRKYDLEDVKVKDKDVWEKTDADKTVKEFVTVVDQPKKIVIP